LTLQRNSLYLTYMNSLKRLIATLVLITSAALPLYSQDSEVVPRLEASANAALDILYLDRYHEYNYEQQQAAVRAILEQNYDLMVLIRRTLGRNWHVMNVEEQMQVTELITQLIVKAYVQGMAGRARPSLEYGAAIQITDQRLEVPSVVMFPDGETYHVVYRLGRLQSGWQIYDIVAEDISIVSNYRQQFDDHFRKGSGMQLIEKLEQLLEQGVLDAATKL